MADISKSISITIDADHEGGFQRNEKDRANWSGGQVGEGELIGTKYGITALDIPGAKIADLTPQQATQWYLTTSKPQRFNNPLYAQINSQLLCDKIFDMGVLFGVETAVKNLQSALGITVDGLFGPGTLFATNAATDASLLLTLFQARLRSHATAIAAENVNDAPDLPDWLRRINS